MKSTELIFIVISFIGIAPKIVGGEEFSEIIVFGDSFTDNGNVQTRRPDFVPSPPYYDGRFSNGPIWVELLAGRLGVAVPTASEFGGSNYAWGGATTGAVENPWAFPDMDSQVQAYLSGDTPNQDQLFIFWGGENDFFLGQTNPSNSVQYLADQISALSSEGAMNFLVLNLPTVNRSGLVPQFNASLSDQLDALRRSDSSLSIVELDYAALELAMIADPTRFGFANVDDPACTNCIESRRMIVPNPDEYRRWDEYHLTAKTNQIVADAAYDVLILEPPVEGDYNRDGSVDVLDIDLQAVEMKKNPAEQDVAKFDHNNDGVINVGQAGPNESNWGDRLIWVKDLRGTSVGDANLDDVFDSGDLVLVFGEGKYDTGEMATWAQGDWSGDMAFDSGDLVLAFQDGGYVTGAAAVPEPASLVMLTGGVIGLATVLRTRRSRV